MRNAEEGSGTSNGAEADPPEISLDVNALISSSSSPPRAYQDSGSDDQLSASGPVTPTDVSGSNITTSRPALSTTTTTYDAAAVPKTEEPRGNSDDNNQDTWPDTFLGLFFQAAVALMMYRVQPQPLQGDSPANLYLSPQPKPQQGDSPLSPLPSVQFNMAWATILLGFALTMSGTMLRNHHRKAANFCSNAGVFLGAVAFLLMILIVADESLDWLVWAVGGVLLVLFAYRLRREMQI